MSCWTLKWEKSLYTITYWPNRLLSSLSRLGSTLQVDVAMKQNWSRFYYYFFFISFCGIVLKFTYFNKKREWVFLHLSFKWRLIVFYSRLSRAVNHSSVLHILQSFFRFEKWACRELLKGNHAINYECNLWWNAFNYVITMILNWKSLYCRCRIFNVESFKMWAELPNAMPFVKDFYSLLSRTGVELGSFSCAILS